MTDLPSPQLPHQLPRYELSSRELRARVWSRLRRQRGTLALSLSLLLLSVPFVNFQPLVSGFDAEHLVEQTLTPRLLARGRGLMLATNLSCLVLGAEQS